MTLDYLLENEYEEKDFILGIDKVPIISYNKGINHYIPDLFIPKENKIVETKSVYTYKADIDKNMKKKEACLREGYNFEFMIWDSRPKRLIEESELQ